MTVATLIISRKKTFFERVMDLILIPYRRFCAFLVKKLLALRAKLQISSLKEAIGLADKNKEKTGRKNMVVFNTHSGKYEPLQKKTLKNAANLTKNKSNKAHTEGRLKMMKEQKPKRRIVDSYRVKKLEERSLYVTK